VEKEFILRTDDTDIRQKEKEILKEYLTDGLDSYNYQANPKLLEEIKKEFDIKY